MDRLDPSFNDIIRDYSKDSVTAPQLRFCDVKWKEIPEIVEDLNTLPNVSSYFSTGATGSPNTKLCTLEMVKRACKLPEDALCTVWNHVNFPTIIVNFIYKVRIPYSLCHTQIYLFKLFRFRPKDLQ